MKIINRLVMRNLKLNKKRAIVSIIGIILATSLITGVTSLVSSYRKTMIEYEKETTGNYHYELINVSINKLQDIQNNENVEKSFITQEIGYTKLENSQNPIKPYGYVIGASEDAMANLNIQVIEGRLPKNENEILIQQGMISLANIEWKIGDEIILHIGKRESNGIELNQNNLYNFQEKEIDVTEEIIPKYTKTYKIVGITKSLNNIEPAMAPGYTMITKLDNYIEGEYLNVFVKCKNLKEGREEFNKYIYHENTMLIQLENMSFKDETMSFIYTIAGIIILIIICTSVYCIRNSFDIAITERIKQYGMLSSIGTTRKQIKHNVLFEGFILGLIGIPLGILVGVLIVFLILKIFGQTFGNRAFGTEFIFSVNMFSIVGAIILNSITIYLSAIKSARKVSKISPIEAIRSNQDIKVESKKIKSPKYIKKLFGIGGNIAYKNLKRNKRKYRTTVISIIVSVSMFIAISSFVQYAFKSVNDLLKNSTYNLQIIARGNYEILQQISKDENVESYSIQRKSEISIEDENALTGVKIYNIYSVGQQEYDRFIKKLGLNYVDVRDKLIFLSFPKQNISDEEFDEYYESIEDLNYKQGDIMQGKINDIVDVNVEIAAATEERPMGMEVAYWDCAIVSDEFLEKYDLEDYDNNREILMYIDAKDADAVERNIWKNYSRTQIENVYNIENNIKNQKALWTLIAAFLYTFIVVIALVGIINIINTIITSMELRQKEFANLKSIGMTSKQFNNMIRLESLFYCGKALIIGIPIGIGMSYIIFNAFSADTTVKYIFPTSAIIISSIAVLLLVSSIMRFSVKKINKQNIIETIRKENI